MFYGIIFVFFWLQNIVTLINFFLFDLSLLIINIVDADSDSEADSEAD